MALVYDVKISGITKTPNWQKLIISQRLLDLADAQKYVNEQLPTLLHGEEISITVSDDRMELLEGDV